MVIVMALAAVVTPGFARLSDVRNNALAREVLRRLDYARTYAMCSGMPTGVRFDVTNQQIPLVRITSLGAPPTIMPSTTGQTRSDPTHADSIPALFAGSSLIGASIGKGNMTETIWFTYAGVPHTRTDDGTYVTTLPEDATIEVSGGRIITVRRLTGLVER